MRNVTHPEDSRYGKRQLLASATAAVSPKFECNDPFGALRLTSGRHESPKNEVDRTGMTVAGGLGSDSANSERARVLAILRAAYRVASGERKRIQTDLDLLVGIARAVEANIYDPAFALARAVEHGLVAWPGVEVAP